MPPDHRLSKVLQQLKLPGPISSATPLDGGGLAIEINDVIFFYDAGIVQRDQFNIPADCTRSLRFQSIAYSTDTSLVAIACDDKIVVMAKGEKGWHVGFVKQIPWGVRTINFDRDHNRLWAALEGGEIDIFNTETGAEEKKLASGADVTAMRSSAGVVTVGSTTGTLLYFADNDFKALGKTAFAPDGISTITADGWYSKLGSDALPVIGYRGGEVLDDEENSKLISFESVNLILFHPTDYLAIVGSMVANTLRTSWDYFIHEQLAAQLLIVTSFLYCGFVFGLCLLWIFIPSLLCALALAANRPGTQRILVGIGK